MGKLQKSWDRKSAMLLADKERRGLIDNPKIRQPRSNSERLIQLESATRERMRARGRQFYYVQIKCPNGHYSRRYVLDGSCQKCVNPNASIKRSPADRVHVKLAEQARRDRLGK
jgi:hypothetical protein